MKRLRLLMFALIGLGTGFGALADHAIASTYADVKTTLAIDETSLEKNRSRFGNYETEAAGRQWGTVQIKLVSTNSGYTLYKGVFRDSSKESPTSYPENMTAGQGCAGDISIRRGNPGTGKPITAEVVWRVTGGKFCSLVGRTVRSTLNETLPRPDKNGDFTSSNAITYLGETSGIVTWLKWQVVDKSELLNCRVAPNGAVKRTYTKGQIILAETRQSNAFMLAKDGSPWMLVRSQQCYVRANKRYVLPVSIPD